MFYFFTVVRKNREIINQKKYTLKFKTEQKLNGHCRQHVFWTSYR